MDTQYTAENIERLMKQQGMSIEDLAQRVGIKAHMLSLVIRGRLVPGSTLVQKIADSLHVESSDILSEYGSLTSLRFRTRQLSNGEKLKRRESIRKATVWLEDYSSLEEALHDRQPCLCSDITPESPMETARSARRVFGMGEGDPLISLTSLLEAGGIKVRLSDFGFSKTSGFSIGEADGGPAIIINRSTAMSVERQIFTIAHELGHLLLHQHSYEPTLESEHAGEEKEANEFAGNFILPEKAFCEAWDAAAGLDFVSKVLRLKGIFSVSYQTVLQRLYQIEDGLRLADLRRRFAIDYKMKYNHDLKNFYEPFPIGPSSIIPLRYPALVRRAYEEGLISYPRATQMLTLSLEDMRRRINDWRG